MRNAADALELLKGPTREVAPNTHLIYLNDQRVALRFHDTIIASYRPEGVKVNVRGWHTRTTWRRIKDFTPAKVACRDQLRYFDTSNGPVLYQPGTMIAPNGDVNNPMLPSKQRRIEGAIQWTRELIREYVATAVERWDAGAVPTCELCLQDNQVPADHLLEVLNGCYMHDHEPQLSHMLIVEGNAHSRDPKGLNEDMLLTKLRKDFTSDLLTRVVPLAVDEAAPGFEFPQSTKGVPA